MNASVMHRRMTARARQSTHPALPQHAEERMGLGPRLRSRGLGAEPPVPCLWVEASKLALAQVHERLVISPFEVEVRLPVEALVHDHLEPVTRAHGRDRTTRTVGEHLRDFGLARQAYELADLRFQIRKPDSAGGWKHSEPIRDGIAEQDRLGQTLTGDMAGLSRAQGRLGGLVGDEIVGALVLREIRWERGRVGHPALLSGATVVRRPS